MIGARQLAEHVRLVASNRSDLPPEARNRARVAATWLGCSASTRHADAIITGDLDLHAIDTEQLGIEILTPRQLVDRLA